ncbi:MAG: hypothetical protein M1838_001583 [Thelocarpon superellum]|nr:MAG: hypothetical protein M1838_001583 [Thelocarpon superellum]
MYSPPPGPPPSRVHQGPAGQEPPPYRDWTDVPDTSLLPPPPILRQEVSPTSNATEEDATRATAWCERHPLSAPARLSAQDRQAIGAGALPLLKPREYVGDLIPRSASTTQGRTWAGTKDACLLTRLPLYSALHHSPLQTGGASKTIYFEVRVHALGRDGDASDSSLAIGFCTQPYPTFRLPGWQRGSLGVHSDDGHRFVNDLWGGKEFTEPFRPGDTVGLGMTFSVSRTPPAYQEAKAALSQTPAHVEVFFTRNGKRVGGWDLHEERDARTDLGVEGLEGRHDVYPAVGVYGGVDFEVSFAPGSFLFVPPL